MNVNETANKKEKSIFYFDALILMIASHILSTPKEFYVFDRYSIFTATEVIGIVTLFKILNMNY